MGLPIQSAPTYTCTLPFSGQEVKYRPFLVKEQKILVLAREGEDQRQIMDAVVKLIHNVTFEKVDAHKLAMVDLEYLFLQVRSVSVGETADITLSCGEEDCAGSGQTQVALNEVEVKGELPEENKFMLNDTTGVILRLPLVDELSKMDAGADEEAGVQVLKMSIETIFDEENIYEASEIDKKDLDEFVESLTLQQVEELSKYFADMPRLEKEVHFKCNLCNTEQTRTLVGLSSFF